MSCVSVRRKDGQGRAGTTSLLTDQDVLTHSINNRNAVGAATSLWLKTLGARGSSTQSDMLWKRLLRGDTGGAPEARGAPPPRRGATALLETSMKFRSAGTARRRSLTSNHRSNRCPRAAFRRTHVVAIHMPAIRVIILLASPHHHHSSRTQAMPRA